MYFKRDLLLRRCCKAEAVKILNNGSIPTERYLEHRIHGQMARSEEVKWFCKKPWKTLPECLYLIPKYLAWLFCSRCIKREILGTGVVNFASLISR